MLVLPQFYCFLRTGRLTLRPWFGVQGPKLSFA